MGMILSWENSITCLKLTFKSTLHTKELFGCPEGWFSRVWVSKWSPDTLIKVMISYAFTTFMGREFNSFILKSSSWSIVCYFHTFGNNLGIKRKFANYFKESCCLSSDQHFSFKCFQNNAFVRKIFPKSSGLFWPLIHAWKSPGPRHV